VPAFGYRLVVVMRRSAQFHCALRLPVRVPVPNGRLERSSVALSLFYRYRFVCSDYGLPLAVTRLPSSLLLPLLLFAFLLILVSDVRSLRGIDWIS
jgi:hypothetical protein